MNVLAIDLGTSSVKAIAWNPQDGVCARASARVPTTHSQPGWDEQDANAWWGGVQQTLDALPFRDFAAVGLSSARETFVCLDDGAQPLRPAILWSDGRAPSPSARWAWLQEHEPDVARQTRWLAAPKDFVLLHLVGRLVTDMTLATRTDVDVSLLPEIVEPRTVVGAFEGVPVIAGAGDRACEVLAVAASAFSPMVSWGTTANCSFPLEGRALSDGWRASAYLDGDQLAEAGLSAAGSALVWLSEQVSVSVVDLVAAAANSPAGANGVVALPWLNGARAPWWRPDALMTVIGQSAEPGDLARAIYEGVAHDLRRALAALPQPPTKLSLAGGGATDPVWQEVLSGVTGLPLTLGEGADAAAVGAGWLALDAARRRGVTYTLQARADPVHTPDPALVSTYAELSRTHDAAALSALGLST